MNATLTVVGDFNARVANDWPFFWIKPFKARKKMSVFQTCNLRAITAN